MPFRASWEPSASLSGEPRSASIGSPAAACAQDESGPSTSGARTGDVLWRFQTGGSVYANPITDLSEGRQFVAIAAGNSLVTFALPD